MDECLDSAMFLKVSSSGGRGAPGGNRHRPPPTQCLRSYVAGGRKLYCFKLRVGRIQILTFVGIQCGKSVI